MLNKKSHESFVVSEELRETGTEWMEWWETFVVSRVRSSSRQSTRLVRCHQSVIHKIAEIRRVEKMKNGVKIKPHLSFTAGSPPSHRLTQTRRCWLNFFYVNSHQRSICWKLYEKPPQNSREKIRKFSGKFLLSFHTPIIRKSLSRSSTDFDEIWH